MNIDLLMKYAELSESQRDQALKLYSCSFPENERRPFNLLIENLSDQSYEMFVYAPLGNIDAIVFVYFTRSGKDALLDYFAVSPGKRGLGIGSHCFQLLVRFLQSKKISLFMEVEDPKHGEERRVKEKRIEFYMQNGARLIKNYDYLLPDLSGINQTTAMKLMITTEGKELSNNDLKIFIGDIFINLYNRNLNDSLLILNLKNVPDQLLI